MSRSMDKRAMPDAGSHILSRWLPFLQLCQFMYVRTYVHTYQCSPISTYVLPGQTALRGRAGSHAID